jgi:hypothetical protein
MYQPYQRPYMTPYGNTYGMATPQYAPQNPMATQQPQVQQQMQMQPQPQAQPNLPQIQEIRYATEEEAKAFIVFPNLSAYFIDLPKNRLYVKSANASGISNIDYFSLTAINPDGSPIKPHEPIPQVNYDDFVTKDQISSMGFVTNAQFETLLQKLETMQKQINSGGRTNGTKQPN